MHSTKWFCYCTSGNESPGTRKHAIPAALALFLLVDGWAQPADETAQRQWTVIERDNGGFEEGFMVDGKRVGQ